jgi:hypothetical protein
MWIPELSLTLGLQREDEAHSYQGKVIAALGENKVYEGDLVLNFQADGVARTVMAFSLAIPAPGILTFSIEGEENALEVLRLPVTQISVERNEMIPQLGGS